jgi:hypothetical protein
MIPKQQYSKASSLSFLAGNASSIIAPALAGFLYGVIGIVGILIIDISSFFFAIVTVLRINIPQPAITESINQEPTNLVENISFGFKYIISRPSLLALLLLTVIFWFIHDIGDVVYKPMILERSGNNTQILGSLFSISGIGGVLSVLLIHISGGWKHRIQGVIFGMTVTGFSKIVLGLGRLPAIWIPSQLCSSLIYPLFGSHSDAIWLTKVKPQFQGRVFATKSMVLLVASSVANLIAGLLADLVFEPAMMPGGNFAPFFGSIFGTEKGSGMALMYVISSFGLLLVGLSGYIFRMVREIEAILPDYDNIV